MSGDDEALLRIESLTVGFGQGDRRVEVVRGVDLQIGAGQTLGLVGESGSGKTVTAMSVLGLVPGAHTTGRILFDGRDLTELAPGQLRAVRGGEIGMVFQDPMSSLNPIRPVGHQIADVVRSHQAVSQKAARRRAVELLDMVGIPKAASKGGALPHEFSGGMRQRVMIAMALSCDPRLLIADEPTTALDVTTQAQILDLLSELRRELHMALLLISHDFGVVAQTVDRVAVMYAGTVVENAEVGQIMTRPGHPYTVGLLDSVRRMGGDRTLPLAPIPGTPPPPSQVFTGCPFAPRCAYVMPRCDTEPPPRRESATGDYLCWLEEPPALALIPESTSDAQRQPDRPTLLTVTDLKVEYERSGLFRGRPGRPAVDGVSLTLREGETLGLVGESGSGKSSTGRAIMRLVPVTGGSIQFLDRDVRNLSRAEYRDYARDVKLVFQDPAASLDPRMTVRDLVEEPLLIHGVKDRQEREERASAILERVGLGSHFLSRYPHELSGGQRQRVAVARALVLSPRLVICDEPVSALDVSVQAQVVNLLRDLRDELNLTYLFISHDLRVVRYMADRIAVMHQGRIVEEGLTDEVYENPTHPYTQMLLDSLPELDTTGAAGAGHGSADGAPVGSGGHALDRS